MSFISTYKNDPKRKTQMPKLTLGTAAIQKLHNGSFRLSYMNHGSFLMGERIYGSEQAAREFCRDRDLRVI